MKNRRLTRFGWKSFAGVALYAMLVISCAPERPPIDEDTWLVLRAELEIINAIHSAIADSAATESMIDDVLAHYEVTRDDVKESFTWYSRDLDMKQRIQEQMARMLDEENIRLTQHLSELRERDRVQQEQGDIPD